MMSPAFKSFATSVLLYFGLTAGTFLGLLSLIYGEFPPPVGKLRQQIKDVQALAKRGTEVKGIQERAKAMDSALAMANPDSTSDPLSPRPVGNSAVAKAPAVTVMNGNPDAAMTEIRQLRFQLQTLQAEQDQIRKAVRDLQLSLQPKAPAQSANH